MILSFTFQCRLFMLTVGLGVLSAFFYHILYIFSAGARLGKVPKGILDIVYWLLLSLTLFFAMLKFNSGEVRPFAVLGTALGMIIYYSGLRSAGGTLICTVYRVIKKFLLLIIHIIMTPVHIIFYPIVRIFLFFANILKKHLQIFEKYEKITIRKLGTYFSGVTTLTQTANKKSKVNMLWTFMMIVIILIFAAALCYQYLVHLQLDTAKQEIEVQIAEAKAESASLTKQYDNQDSAEFIEKVAREQLNMVYPSELVYINVNSEEGKKLLNSIKRSSAKSAGTDADDTESTRVE